MENEVIETKTAKVWLGDDGIIRAIALPDLKVTLEIIKEVNAHIKKLYKGKKVPVFADIRGVKSITREARLLPSSEDSVNVCSAAALLIGSPLSKVIGNLFIGLNKPPYPTKLFKKEDEAVEWLKGFVEKKEL